MKSQSPLVFWSLACTLLASCGGNTLQGPDGTLQLKMQWPTSGFRTQVIPAETERIELQIMALGSATVNATLQRTPGATEARWQQSFAPGEKRLSARAFNAAGRVLAEGETTVLIRAGQKAQAVIDLVPEAPQPSPTPTPTPPPASSGGEGAANPGTQPPITGGGETPPSTSPESPAPTSPVPASSPLLPNFSGGGGSGGGGGGSTAPVLTAIVADPAILSGMGFPTYLTTTVNVTNPSPTEFSWSCQEVNETNTTVIETSCPGSSFSPATAAGPQVYWTAPGLDTIGSISLEGLSKYYRLTVTYSNSSGSDSESILITVPVGGGSAYPTGGQK